MTGGFHNPYTFVPALPRDHVPPSSPLGDRPPTGHHLHHRLAWNGRLRVELTVHTPLLLLDPARASWDRRQEHLTLAVRLRDGVPRIEPTSLKGMLRAAYEAVTNSRFGVFSKHEAPLAHAGGPWPRSPRQLLEASLPGIEPAAAIDRLSPADRVFGWVPDGWGGSACRGQLRVGQVRCATGDAVVQFPRPLPLAILSSPKPKQARFYLGDLEPDSRGRMRVARQRRDRSSRDAGYTDDPGRTLRGRKVYPHHAGLEDLASHWSDPWEPAGASPTGARAREYRRVTGPGKPDRDKQNVSVTGWVRAGARFDFEVRFWNLAAVELGALVWLLELPPDCFLRLGAGRPLGFGSVRLGLVRGESELVSGADVARWYQSLGGDRPSAAPDTYDRSVGGYHAEVRRQYGSFAQAEPIRAFVAAARGHRGPVHYPRLSQAPDPAGRSYQWFVRNDDLRAGGRGWTLPDAGSGERLPYDPRSEPVP